MKLDIHPRYTEVLVLAAAGLGLVSYAGIAAPVPTWYAPFSLPVVIPALLLGTVLPGPLYPLILASAVLPVLFLLWSRPLFSGQVRIPLRSKVLALVLVGLSAVFLAASWSHGVRYQGMPHTLAIYAFNAGLWFGLLLLERWNAKWFSFGTNLGFHWLLFAWLAWIAFPWFGELI